MSNVYKSTRKHTLLPNVELRNQQVRQYFIPQGLPYTTAKITPELLQKIARILVERVGLLKPTVES